MMCPLHIRRTIEEIKGRLKDSSATVRVVSTQLIEAGVDIDFPAVFRQLSGLDSILQAAGRCNREAKADNGIVNVFDIQDYRPHGDIKFAIDSVKTMMSRHDTIDWFSPESMREYYEILYSNTPDFDKNKIGEFLDNPFSAAYEEGARRFKMIQDTGIPVIVNYGDAEELIKELKSFGVSRQLFRKLGLYTVTINKRLFDEHFKAGLIETVYDGIFYMPLASQYDSKTGLKVNNEYIENTFVI